MDTKKICYVTTLPITFTNFILESAKYIYERTGWDIYFICNTDPRVKEELPEYIHYVPLVIKRGISLTGFKSVVDIYRVMKTEKFDLVQYSTTNAATYASIASRFAKVPVRLYCQWGLDYPAFSGAKKVIWKFVERIICSNSTVIQPDSNGNLDICISDGLYHREKGYVVGNGSASGVDLQRFNNNRKSEWRQIVRKELGIDDNTFVFGYVGRLLRDKGINELLLASKQLFKKHPNSILMIVGDNTSFEKIQLDLLNWAKSSERVLFTGFTKETEKYYAVMDCFVLPSYHEGFGTSIIEAEAMSVPCIVTDIPGPREAAKKGSTALFIEKANPEDLLQAMETIIESPVLCDKLSKNGLKYATEMFDQDYLFEEIYLDRKKLLMK